MMRMRSFFDRAGVRANTSAVWAVLGVAGLAIAVGVAVAILQMMGR